MNDDDYSNMYKEYNDTNNYGNMNNNYSNMNNNYNNVNNNYNNVNNNYNNMNNNYNNTNNNFSNMNNNFNKKSKRNIGRKIVKIFNGIISRVLAVALLTVAILFILTKLKIIDNPLNLIGNPFDEKIDGITINQKELLLKKGDSFQLITDSKNHAIRYESSNTNVVKVNEITGYIEGVNIGNATITVYLKNDKSVNDVCYVKVDYYQESKPNIIVDNNTPISSDKKIEVTGISVSNNKISLDIGGEQYIPYIVVPKNATNTNLFFSSSNNKVAIVNGNGLVIGMGAGTATITIKSNNGKTATCEVNVSNKISSTYRSPTSNPISVEIDKTKTKSRIHFISTGSSDAIIIESKGHFGLIDASSPYNDGTPWSSSISSNSVQHVIDYLYSLGVNKLDFIVATHSHSDHIGGMVQIANKYVNKNTKYYYKTYIDTLEDYETNWDSRSYYQRTMNVMKNIGVNLQEVTNKEPTITIGDFTIQLLNTAVPRANEYSNGKVIGENKNSIVEYITYKGKYKTLLASDMEREDEMDVANKIGHVDILKAGHHSYFSSTSYPFINKLTPKTIVITNKEIYKTFLPMSYYLQQVYGTKIYPTGNTQHAIVVEYSDKEYKVTPENANTKIEATKSEGEWKLINNTMWMVYKNNMPMYNSWYQDSSGKRYYLDETGSIINGFKKISWNNTIKWFYFDDRGAALTNTCPTLNNIKFCFDKNGVCISGGYCG